MSRKKRRVASPPEYLAFLERARRNAENSPPKQHHLVPSSYLKRWSDNDLIRVTHVNDARSYITSVGRAAREAHYYRLESPDVDPQHIPPLLFETMLSEVEGWGARIIDHMVETAGGAMDLKDFSDFAWYLGFQYTRGHGFRQQMRAMANDLNKIQFEGISRSGVRELLVMRGLPATDDDIAEAYQFFNELNDGTLEVRQQDAAVIGYSGKAAFEIGEGLLSRNWCIFSAPPVLVTCDEPVVTIGGPGANRRERAGINTAGAVIFPLSPSFLLVMFHPDMDVRPSSFGLDRLEVLDINREILAATSRWAFERPSRHVTEKMKVPPAAPYYARERPISVQGDENRKFFRSYRPTRWHNEVVVPPWPVPRWWY